MKSIYKLRGKEEFHPAYIGKLIVRAKVSGKRKVAFKDKKKCFKRKHWANHAGTYHDEEFKKGPKYFHSGKPVRVYRSIRSYHDLVNALQLIALGRKNQDHYVNVQALDRERLRLAQSWRDKKISYVPKDIIGLGIDGLQERLNLVKNRKTSPSMLRF